MLNPEQYQAKWPEIRAGVRNLWGHLTEREIEGAKEDLYALSDLVVDRYHESKTEIHSKINHLLESFDNETDKNISPDTSSYMRSPLDNPEDARKIRS
ncbi:MAG: hypothetical protein ACLGHN_09350 [Bacteriovoracia bacterium]